jgi:hypothetical protein
MMTGCRLCRISWQIVLSTFNSPLGFNPKSMSSCTPQAIQRSSVTRATAANRIPVVRHTTSRIVGTASMRLTLLTSALKSCVMAERGFILPLDYAKTEEIRRFKSLMPGLSYRRPGRGGKLCENPGKAIFSPEIDQGPKAATAVADRTSDVLRVTCPHCQSRNEFPEFDMVDIFLRAGTGTSRDSA